MQRKLIKVSNFNPQIDAAATLKERFVWLVYMGALFFLLYGAANQFAAVTAPHYAFFFDWERSIPFVPAFIVPYMSSDVVFVVAFLLAQTRLELRILSIRVLFIVLVSVCIFILSPLQFSFEKPTIESFNFLFTLLEADKPYNQLPSLHASFSLVFWFCMKDLISNRWLKAALACWLTLIVLSTLFVYQHHLIDLPTGLIVGFLSVYLFNKRTQHSLLTHFMTPRHLKMALYFLLASLVFMLLSFTVSAFFIYFFICMLSVSLVYAFGFSHFLVAQEKVNILQWLIFSPYFLGCKISWHFYKRSIPLHAKIDDGLFFGRFPDFDEYQEISGLGIKRVINLASELQFNKTQLIQHRLNYLDQTIQSPESLHKAVKLIETHKSEGVYVHCALGLSRSILVIWAWMLFNGKTDKEIAQQLIKLRPRYVQSKYMQINVALYQEFLKNNGLATTEVST